MLFKRVSMRDLDKYTKTPEPLKGISCQLGITGPQFFEAKGAKGNKEKKEVK